MEEMKFLEYFTGGGMRGLETFLNQERDKRTIKLK